MSYIARFFKWMIRGIIHFIKEFIVFAIRQAISIIRFSLPYFYWLIITVLGLMLQMSILNFLALIRPIPDVARKAAEDWSDTAVRDGWFPSLHQLTLVKILYVVAILAMTVGLLVNLFTMIFAVDIGYLLITAR
jgi:hypothetical protein